MEESIFHYHLKQTPHILSREQWIAEQKLQSQKLEQRKRREREEQEESKRREREKQEESKRGAMGVERDRAIFETGAKRRLRDMAD